MTLLWVGLNMLASWGALNRRWCALNRKENICPAAEMPTTVDVGQKKKGDKPSSSSKNLDLLCSVKYTNTLPDIPFDPKFLTYPFDAQRFIQYNPTSLERNHKHELLTEVDLGIPIDLILPETYAIGDSAAVLDPIDEALLEEEIVQQPESKRARQHAKNVSWLRRTEYISTEYARPHGSGDGAETKVGYSVKKKLQGMDVYKDRASQIAAIEATFEAAKQPITKHYSKPGVEARDVLPLFPDFDLWKLPFAQVLFDSDPAVLSKSEGRLTEEMSQAMIRGMMDENNEQFVAYFLPTNETMTKRKEDEQQDITYREEEDYEYQLTREYNWNVKNKASKGYEETYFLVTRPGQGVFYNEIETRVRLSKRRTKASKSAMNSKLVVRHRELMEDEMYAQEIRLAQLEPPVIEEDEEGGWEDMEGGGHDGSTSPTSPTEGEEEGGSEERPVTEEGDDTEEQEADSEQDEFEQAFGSGEDDDDGDDDDDDDDDDDEDEDDE